MSWSKCFQKCFGRKYFIWPLASFACGIKYHIPKCKQSKGFHAHSQKHASFSDSWKCPGQSTSRNRMTAFVVRSSGKCCRSTVLTIACYLPPSHCLPAQTFVSVSRELKSQPFTVCVGLLRPSCTCTQCERRCYVVTKRELSNPAKLSVFKSVFVPILTYGHESWFMTENISSQV